MLWLQYWLFKEKILFSLKNYITYTIDYDYWYKGNNQYDTI